MLRALLVVGFESQFGANSLLLLVGFMVTALKEKSVLVQFL